nr:hypothetical protein [uncultured Haemophilus sp.]
MKDVFESLLEGDEKTKIFRLNQARNAILEALRYVNTEDFYQLADECIYKLVAENAMLDHHTAGHYETL